MKEVAEEIDINEEYERLVPPTVRNSLFDESEDYESLREYIMSQPYYTFKKSGLPFAGVKLIDYVQFRFWAYVEEATSRRRHLFFISQSEKGQPDYCYAAGYYSKTLNQFLVLPYSYIVNLAYTETVYQYVRTRKDNVVGCNRYITSLFMFEDPEKAATFVLGQKAGIDEWVDRRGKGLLNYYPELAVEPAAQRPGSTVNNTSEKGNSISRHIFEIFVSGVCKAKGYYDDEKGHFYILKDSLLALNAEPEYERSASGTARDRLLASVCFRRDGFYVVNKDAKCRSASAAASYVLGRTASYVEWEDESGKGLMDFFPDRFYMKKDKSQDTGFFIDTDRSKEKGIHMFYIKKFDVHGRGCDANGYYDPITKTFVLKEGSQWATEVTKAYQFTASELLRRNLIKRHCVIQFSNIIQKRDVLCDSPSAAASFVLGRTANGWDEWKDESGNTLKEIYKNADAEDVQKRNR